ncbi:MAG: Aldehyde Dehydrogenase [Candidatus Gottesmanbacteria bacterium GW2011_GWC2_39_8]|uniref:Aldehyde Dehydrogenase n=1 Tax=Candidatus Gottesmanbacteria bacterium GW2011_GWC2_39_8 TaxID=1618450 RepID=A0A0G0Q2H3_9BACT|nr:MAG: Aldehyde Dehydrogenase [Candidatus Gottesmanbacteria bacterium GW2011_GWC2_39_8]
MKLISTNPGKNYSVLGTVEVSGKEEIKKFVNNAREALFVWKNIGLRRRLVYLNKLYDIFGEQKDEIARRITEEVGKPIRQTKAEVGFFQSYSRWMLDNAERILKDEITFEDKNSIHKIVYEPSGIAAAILPWNSPFGMLSWKLFSNLIAGNPVIVKHSEECPLIAMYLDGLIQKIGLPKGVYSQIYGDGESGAFLLNQDINLVCFSGSSDTGRGILEITSDRFIKHFLEMGGSNPGIVFKDANIDKIIGRIFAGRFNNCGQNCDAIKRLIVHKDVFEKVADALNNLLKEKVIGDPEDEKTDFGTLVSEKQKLLATDQLDDAIAKGAKITGQLKVPGNLKGGFFPPTLLTKVTKDMRVWKEEVFAPILPTISFETEEEVVSLANDTEYGLGASIFTEDKKRAKRVASLFECSNVELNNTSQFLPCNPFGGVKNSTLGSQHGDHGMRELCNIKVLSFEK